MTTKKVWSYFLHFTVAVALFVAIKGLSAETARVDSTLGNAAYMAVYMLFNIFFVGFLSLRSKDVIHRGAYLIVGLLLVYTLLLTGTRGTFLGFAGGAVAAVTYIALFGRSVPSLRKYAIGGVFALAVLGLTFIGVKDMDFIQDTPALSRIANIDLQKDLTVRTTIWGMAWEGVKERPLLGWGQGNFNYVFNEQYDPFLYNQEQWFDRVHNIFFDWLIAGGFLGFIAYFSIMAAIVYYLFVEPVILKKKSNFTILERAVLLGLLVGYLMHNLVVFDNIISYIFYGTMIGLIHSRVSKPIQKIENYSISPQMVTQFTMPIVIIVAGASIYFINVPGIQTTSDMIDALVAPTIPERLEEFHSALSRDSFANQEVVEQLAQQAMNVVRNQNIPDQDKSNIIQRAELELLKLADDKPGDARVHNFISSFYRAIGAMPQAREQAVIAHELSPNKPALILEQAIIELQAGDDAAAVPFMKQAFELDERNTQARVLYATTLIRIGELSQAKEIIGQDYLTDFAVNDYALSNARAANDLEFLGDVFAARIEAKPDSAQDRASLAFIKYQLEDIDASIEILKDAGRDIPEFAKTAQCYVSNLEEGNAPDEGC
jgi:tetratricopeptide (TPR) repeat protein